MLTDPMSVTYNGSAKSLVRVYTDASLSKYRTADGEFEVVVSNDNVTNSDGERTISIELSRWLPDPTPADVFDPYRRIRNTFGISYRVDVTQASTSVDLPLLRTALLAFVDSTLQGRLLAGEK